MRLLIRYLRARSGFTLIELLTVMAIIAVIAALILSIAGYAQKKGATSRAQAEIQAISAACEAYKSDNGTYPRGQVVKNGAVVSGTPSDVLYSVSSYSPSMYQDSSLMLYQALTGDTNNLGPAAPPPNQKNYLQDIKPDLLGRSSPTLPVKSSNPVQFLSDPFGNSYGYSTAYATSVQSGTGNSTYGFNPTFDLWSTSGQVNSSGTVQWIKNW